MLEIYCSILFEVPIVSTVLCTVSLISQLKCRVKFRTETANDLKTQPISN